MLQLKRKAREAGETEAGVTLATGTDSEDDQGGQLAQTVQNDQESDEDAGGAYEGGLTSSDEDEQVQKRLQQAGSSKAGQAAYFGMQKSNVSATAKEYAGLSLAEQEALALKMIKK